MEMKAAPDTPEILHPTHGPPRPGLQLTEELEALFLEDLKQQGRAEDTVNGYRRSLSKLRQHLQSGGSVDSAVISTWQAELLSQGYSASTVNCCTAAVNSLLEFAGRRDLQAGQIPSGDSTQPELSRAEYHRLLQAAKHLGKRRAYLLVLLFGSIDLPLQALPCVTVEAVEAGWIPGSPRLRVPPSLQAQLLSFAEDTQVCSGPIFQSRTGAALLRTNVNTAIQSLSRAARVPPEKCNPRCLRKLCLATQKSIREPLELLAEQTYDRLLDTEALTLGWEEDGTPQK